MDIIEQSAVNFKWRFACRFCDTEWTADATEISNADIVELPDGDTAGMASCRCPVCGILNDTTAWVADSHIL